LTDTGDLKKETRGKGARYKSPLARIMRCQFCGLKIQTDQEPKKKKTYTYIRCSSGKNQTEPDYYLREQKRGSKYCMTGYHIEELVMEAIDEEVLAWLEHELKELKSTDENRKQKRQAELEKEKKDVEAKIERVEDAYEEGKYTLERFEARIEKHESRLKEIESQLAQLNLASDDLQDQVELILELMEAMQNQWFTLDYAQKVSTLDVLAEKVTLEEGGTSKPLIIWDLPWKAIHQIGSSSNISMWYARTDSNCRPSDS
jgi:predicted RNase H-like nuclease (RuvC/YqgF family)